MAYDFFSQMQGPVIPINLFGENYGSGAGVADKTNAFKQGVEGLISGAQTGVGISKDLSAIQLQQSQVALNEAEIENLPAKTKDKELQNKRAETSYQLDVLRLAQAQATQQLALNAEKTKLQADTAKATDELDLINTRNDLLKQYGEQATAQGKFNVINNPDPKVQRLLGEDHNLFAQLALGDPAVRALYPEDQLNQIKMTLKQRQEQDNVAAQARREEPDFLTNKQLFGKTATYAEMQKRSGIHDMDELTDKTSWYPTGSISYDPTTRKVNKTQLQSGESILTRGFGKNPDNTYIGVVNDEVVAEKVHKDDYDLAIKLQAGKPVQDGSVAAQKRAQVAAQAQRNNPQLNQQTQSGTALPPEVQQRQGSYNVPQSTVTGSTAPVDTTAKAKEFTPVQVEVQSTFNLTPRETENLREPLDQLTNVARQYASNPTRAALPALDQTKTDTFDLIGRQIADTEYTKSPALQAKYTPETVAAYNISLDREAGSTSNKLTAAYKIATPSDYYYYMNRGRSLNIQLQMFFDRILDIEQERKDLPQAASDQTQRALEALNSTIAQ